MPMMIEEFADIVEVRTGRHIYIRKVVIGHHTTNSNTTVDDDNNNNDDDEARPPTTTVADATATAATTILPQQQQQQQQQQPVKNLQLIFVHGLCGTEQQFQLLLQSMHDQLIQAAAATTTTSTMPQLIITGWLYDQYRCGQSQQQQQQQQANNSDTTNQNNYNYNDYSHQETTDDFKAVLHYIQQQNQIRTTTKNDDDKAEEEEQQQQQPDGVQQPSTILVGHSYGPSVFIPLFNVVSSDPDDVIIHNNINVVGFIFINTSVRCSHLPIPDGGHWILRLPVVVLQCLQSQLTESFIKMAVHPNHIQLQTNIRTASQSNSMIVAQSYHRQSKWMTMTQLRQAVAARYSRRRHRRRTNHNHNTANHHPPPPQELLPTLFIHGVNDGITPIECAQYMYNQLSAGFSPPWKYDNDDDDADVDDTAMMNHHQSTTTTSVTFVAIEEASHMTMMEQPQQTAQAIIQFIVAQNGHW